MKKIYAIIISLLLVFVANSGKTQEVKFKSLYIYNFTKYIGWPPASKSGDFIICVYGSSAIYNKLNEIANGKMAGSQKISVKKISNVDEISNCHILFVAYGKSGTSNMSAITQKIGNNSTLLITERDGSIQKGAIINFVVKNELMKFELSKKNAMKHGLQVSSSLEKLAILAD